MTLKQNADLVLCSATRLQHNITQLIANISPPPVPSSIHKQYTSKANNHQYTLKNDSARILSNPPSSLWPCRPTPAIPALRLPRTETYMATTNKSPSVSRNTTTTTIPTVLPRSSKPAASYATSNPDSSTLPAIPRPSSTTSAPRTSASHTLLLRTSQSSRLRAP
jgi:hypothetical protein